MLKSQIFPFIMAIVCMVCGACGESQAKMTISGYPSIGDGDTITIEGQRIRLLGIDSCERGQTAKFDDREIDCYQTAKDFLSELIDSKRVICRYSEEDQYGRLLAVCSAEDTELNRAMIKSGQAIVYRLRGQATYPELIPTEREAQRARRGLWGSDFQDPSEFRRSPRSN